MFLMSRRRINFNKGMIDIAYYDMYMNESYITFMNDVISNYWKSFAFPNNSTILMETHITTMYSNFNNPSVVIYSDD